MNAMNAENRIDEVDAQPSTPAEESSPGESAPETSAVSSEQEGTAEASASETAQATTPEQQEGGAQGIEQQGDAQPESAQAAVPPEGMEAVAPRRRGHVAPAHIPLERIDEDTTFQIRPAGDLSALATDLARLGQLFPVDVRFKPPDRFQIISGFRRVAALRFLKRDRVLARLHTDLSDEDALLMALASAIHASPVDAEELEALKARLEAEGRLTPIARDMLDKALVSPDESLASETVEEEEVDADELAAEATQRLVDINQDLALLADVFADLDETRKQELITQLRYSADLVAWLERL
ncbi:ParB-like nuclease family protein [Archangium gephyra]|uniref:ParB-like nuclease domain protein n=1 Tax=Archangium gephyra TaxID=48 RepID=A0AAC8Q8B6_9BACT|nr:ParB/RepB/Spo0J family partition protein [Archangium gephyra]AKJ02709.1 ParB-like nuclease domain protein [Archangium gephyra]REG23254.1 ParB-like nuclease family protein [Archangium gephyra]